LPSNIHAASLTDTGLVRAGNEDTFGSDPATGLYVVCDGMGGAAAGEVASLLACSIALEVFATLPSTMSLEHRLSAAVRAANTAVFTAGQQPDRRGMGTTLVAAAVVGSKLLIANIGDSRAYILQHETWRQLTVDHSYINELVRVGTIKPTETDAPELQRYASIITRAIGASADVQPDLFPLDLLEGDTVLLASDGLTRYLDAPDFPHLIDPTNLEASCQRLINAANKQGGIDNITCTLLRYSTS